VGVQRELLLVDADVLIDYALADASILGLAARHLGSVHVLRSVLAEVSRLAAGDCDRLGVRIVEPSLDQLLEAGAARGRLSFNDRLCLLVAHDAGWTCVTNDRALRRACGEHQVPLWWGLELMLALVRVGELEAGDAVAVAAAIRAGNPRHITADILERFAREVARGGATRGPAR
jgi:predicted nucleic acid-binding protein